MPGVECGQPGFHSAAMSIPGNRRAGRRADSTSFDAMLMIKVQDVWGSHERKTANSWPM